MQLDASRDWLCTDALMLFGPDADNSHAMSCCSGTSRCKPPLPSDAGRGALASRYATRSISLVMSSIVSEALCSKALEVDQNVHFLVNIACWRDYITRRFFGANPSAISSDARLPNIIFGHSSHRILITRTRPPM
jgi:hypothetical protein